MNRRLIPAAVMFLLGTAAAQVEIVAHRGASADAPENTLSAVKLAWEQKADAVELDLHLSKDGKLVVFHDTDTGRFEKPARKVASLTLEELTRLDVGTWKDAKYAGERIPSLESILALTPKGGRVFLELKTGPKIVPEFTRVLRAAARPAGELCVISFDFEALRESHRCLPELEHYYLSGWKPDRKTGKGPDFAPVLARAREAKFTGLDLQHTWPLTAADTAAIKAAGLGLAVWTVNDPAIARRWIGLGASFITTDKPGLMRAALAAEKP